MKKFTINIERYSVETIKTWIKNLKIIANTIKLPIVNVEIATTALEKYFAKPHIFLKEMIRLGLAVGWFLRNWIDICIMGFH